MNFLGRLGNKISEGIKEAGVKVQMILNLLAHVYQYVFCLHSKIYFHNIQNFGLTDFFFSFIPWRRVLGSLALIVSEEISTVIWIVVPLYEIYHLYLTSVNICLFLLLTILIFIVGNNKKTKTKNKTPKIYWLESSVMD